MSRRRAHAPNGKAAPSITDPTYVLVATDGTELARFGAAVERATYAARSRQGAFVVREQDGLPMTTPADPRSLARWRRRAGKDAGEPTRAKPARKPVEAPKLLKPVVPTMKSSGLTPDQARAVLDGARNGDPACEQAVITALCRKTGGPAPCMSAEDLARIASLREQGLTQAQIAAEMKVSIYAIWKYLKRARAGGARP